MLRGKKANERIYVALASLIIVALGVILIFNIVKTVNNEERYLLDYYATDFSLLLESIQAIPGDVLITYPLEENYVVNLEETTLRVSNTRQSTTQKKTIQLLPGIQTENSTVKELARIQKQAGTITLLQENIVEEEKQSCPPSTLKNISVELRIGTIAPTSNLDAQQLELIKKSFEHALTQKNLLDKDKTKILLIFSAAEPQNLDELTIRRPQATGEQETNYNHFFCNYYEQLNNPKELYTETLSTPTKEYRIELIFKPTKDYANTLLTKRTTYAEALARTLQQAQGENK